MNHADDFKKPIQRETNDQSNADEQPIEAEFNVGPEPEKVVPSRPHQQNPSKQARFAIRLTILTPIRRT